MEKNYFGLFVVGLKNTTRIVEGMVSSNTFHVGAVLFPDFELLDVYGPLEMFGVLRDKVSISMLAQTSGEISSNQGPKGVADVGLDQNLAYDLLLVPGGWGTRAGVQNPALLDLLRARAKESKIVTSVCTGSALLAKAGLLDGKRATTNKQAFDWVVSQGPHVEWVREARWVQDGDVFSSSGVTAGMDMTLAIIQRVFGRETALEVARGTEYLWNQDSTDDPFA